MIKIEELWVSKIVTNREWKNYYRYHSSYCFLNKNKEGVKVGFLVANPIRNGQAYYPPGVFPDSCSPLTDEEMRQVDQYRRGHNIHPTPLTEVEDKKPSSSSSSSSPPSSALL